MLHSLLWDVIKQLISFSFFYDVPASMCEDYMVLLEKNTVDLMRAS
jgi:hypothetical protein